MRTLVFLAGFLCCSIVHGVEPVQSTPLVVDCTADAPKAKPMADLEIAEIPYANGQIKYRYARYLAQDGKRWIRHGRFVAYYENGTVQSEGNYAHGLEHGPWRDYHANGKLAAEGDYACGKESGTWHFWSDSGEPEADQHF